MNNQMRPLYNIKQMNLPEIAPHRAPSSCGDACAVRYAVLAPQETDSSSLRVQVANLNEAVSVGCSAAVVVNLEDEFQVVISVEVDAEAKCTKLNQITI